MKKRLSRYFSPDNLFFIILLLYLLFYSTFVFFGKNRLKSSDTTNTPATAFPLNTSPTALGNAAKKFPDVCVRPTPILNDNDTIIIVLSSNLHSFSILIPSYMIDPNIITVHPPSTACGSELKNAPSGGNKDASIRISAPIRIVKRLITCVIVTSPIF